DVSSIPPVPAMNGVFTDQTGTAGAAVIAQYIKGISVVIRSNDQAGACVIFGPDFTFHQADNGNMLDDLSDLSQPANNIFVSTVSNPGYIDVYSFHNYVNSSLSKTTLIDKPYYQTTSSYHARLSQMQLKVASA